MRKYFSNIKGNWQFMKYLWKSSCKDPHEADGLCMIIFLLVIPFVSFKWNYNN